MSSTFGQCRGFLTTASLEQNRTYWKQREKYTIRPIGMKKTGGRDHSGKHCGRILSNSVFTDKEKELDTLEAH